jgi:hypothetical protein
MATSGESSDSDRRERSANQGWTARLEKLAPVLAIVAVAWYSVLTFSYDQFYRRLTVSLGDVGLSYSSILANCGNRVRSSSDRVGAKYPDTRRDCSRLLSQRTPDELGYVAAILETLGALGAGHLLSYCHLRPPSHQFSNRRRPRCGSTQELAAAWARSSFLKSRARARVSKVLDPWVPSSSRHHTW